MAKKKSKKKHKKSNKAKVAKQTVAKKPVKAPNAKKSHKVTESKASTTKTAVDSDSRKYLTFILLAIAGVLLIAILVLANQANEARDDVTDSVGQEDLLKVQPGNPDSLQPTTGEDGSNPQQSSPSPQGSTGSAGDIQPQTPVTPEQQEQLQQ